MKKVNVILVAWGFILVAISIVAIIDVIFLGV